MPRQRRKPPWRLTRFNYWNYAGVCPQSADEAKTFSPAWVRAQGHETSRQQFLAHREGRSCKLAGCRVDRQLPGADQVRRDYLALRHYIRSDRLWTQDREARQVRLPPALQGDLQKLERNIGGQRKQTWTRLLPDIARDQGIFETIIRKHSSGCLEQQAQTTYRVYSRHMGYLLGQIRGRAARILAGKGRPTFLKDPIVPRRRIVWRSETVQEHAPGGFVIRSTSLTPAKGSALPESKRREMALHWFAHAWRNLNRMVDAKPPLPLRWTQACADRCAAGRTAFLRAHTERRPPATSSSS